MEERSLFSPRALVVSLLVGSLVILDPDNYGPDGFPWWINLLAFLTISCLVYFLWYGTIDKGDKPEVTVKKTTQLIVGSIAMAVLLGVILVMSIL